MSPLRAVWARLRRSLSGSATPRTGTSRTQTPRAQVATGPLRFDYRPRRDGKPDPGEIVWAWVPFEENDGRGKDRPVLVVSREGSEFLALMLTSKDHNRDAAWEARHGRYWYDIGAGPWDRQRRPSEVRLDRVLRVQATDVRREGSPLSRDLFDQVAAAAQRMHGGF